MRPKANSIIRGTRPFTLRLPQIFPTMTGPDVITVLHWYAHEGEILQPPDSDSPAPLLEVETPYGEIEITVPPFLRVPHRIVAVLKPAGSAMQLGDQFIALQAVETDTI